MLVSALGATWSRAAASGGDIGRPISTVLAVTLPQPGASRSLSGVACPAPDDCWAVGSYQTTKGAMKNLVLRWEGNGWQGVHSPNPGPGGALSAISCPAERVCWAAGQTVGTIRTAPRNEMLRWSGSAWVLKPVPSRQSLCDDCNFSLSAIECASIADCIAAGTAGSADEYFYQALRRSPAGWSAGKIASDTWGGDAEQGVNGLDGTACVTAANCWAVGNTGCNGDCSGGNDVVVHWDGAKWSKVKVHSPGDTQDYGTGPQLNAVTCTSGSDCWAVGFYYDSRGATLNQILRWNGTAWLVAPAPGQASGDNTSLTAVTCTGPSACWAVGSGDHSTNEILRWDGLTWRQVDAPTPGGPDAALPSALADVACSSSTSCWTVGSYAYHARHRQAFNQVLYWNGSHWTLEY
jgi:hypothetical protein